MTLVENSDEETSRSPPQPLAPALLVADQVLEQWQIPLGYGYGQSFCPIDAPAVQEQLPLAPVRPVESVRRLATISNIPKRNQ